MTQTLSPNLRLIGRYTILRELRRDRYTVVYLAFDPVLNRELIVKAVQLRASNGNERSAHQRIEQAFSRQAQAAGRLHHPHILTVFDAGLVNNIGYLALEKVDGKLLEELMLEGYRPGYLQAADIAARVADAMEFAHSKGVPHGHLAPSRIYLQNGDRMPKVMGFGGWIDNGTTGDFELRGTESMLPYFGNELGSEARRKDVRALGGLLFLLLTGTRPDARLLRTKPGVDEGPVLRLKPNAPLPLAEIVDGALELSGSRPYATAAQVRNALTTFLWGNRGTEGLPNTATITGMPARLTVVPARPEPMTVATIMQATPEPGKKKLSNAVRMMQFVTMGIGLAAAAAMAAVWMGSRGQKAGDMVVAPTRAAVPPAASHGNPTEPANAAVRFNDPAPRTAPRAPAAAPTDAPQGVVALAIAPWGEVFVDGALHGTTPPLSQLVLPAGRHLIEVRNGRDAPHVVQVDVSPERTAQIRHRFQ